MIEKATGEVFELVDEITAMCAAVRDGAPLPATGEDGRWSVAMCLLAQQVRGHRTAGELLG
jgi:myo-inositol 2-dehydrogenase/D-chiro-inositol 1-dehydrogenase